MTSTTPENYIEDIDYETLTDEEYAEIHLKRDIGRIWENLGPKCDHCFENLKKLTVAEMEIIFAEMAEELEAGNVEIGENPFNWITRKMTKTCSFSQWVRPRLSAEDEGKSLSPKNYYEVIAYMFAVADREPTPPIMTGIIKGLNPEQDCGVA